MLIARFNFTKYLRPIAILLIIAGFLGFAYGPSFAVTGINRQINFQGKLVNTDGTNVTNGNYTVIFSIYDHPTTGSPTSGYLWKETQTVSVTDGIFRVMLGSSTAFPANFNFNWSGLYLGMKVNADNEMTPRVEMTAVPYAFNAEKVAGLTVQDESGNASTSGILKIPNAKTVSFAGATSFGAGTTGLVTLGSNTDTLAFTTAGATAITLPTSGTILTNTAAAIQTITSTQSTGTILGITDATALTGAIKGAVITLSGANAQDQTGLEFNLSNATGTNLNDIVGTGGLWKVSKAGALTVASCSGCGAGGGVSLGPSTSDILTSAYTAISINQQGAGALINLQQSGATKFNIGNNGDSYLIGKFTVGSSAVASANFNVYSTIATTATFTNTTAHSPTAGSGMIGYSNSGAAMSSGDRLGFFLAGGAKDAVDTLANTVGWSGWAAENWSATATGSYMVFETTAKTTTTRREVMRLTDAGNLGIGTTSPQTNLEVLSATTSVASVSATTSGNGLVFTGNSGAIIQSLRNGTLTIGGDTTGNITFSPRNGSGAVTIGNSTNGLTFDVTNGGPTYSGTARPTRTVNLIPEYPGATFTPDGSSNTGSVTTDFCSDLRAVNTAATPTNTSPCDSDLSEEHNYYTWTSTSATQDYDIWVRWQVPSDFSGWDTLTNAIQVYGWRTDATTNVVTVSMFDTAGAAVGSATNVATGTSQWTQTTVVSTPTGTYTVGGYVTFRIQMLSDTIGDHVKVGEIEIDYKGKF